MRGGFYRSGESRVLLPTWNILCYAFTMSPNGDYEILSQQSGQRGSGRRAKASITQANQLALSRQDMGILTKRLLILAMSDITRSDYQLEPIRITAWEYAQLFGIRGKSIYSRIEESARELLEQTIQVKEPNGNWTMFQWVSEARYDGGQDSPDGMACIEIKIHDKLSPYLLQLKRDYSIIPTDQLLSFDSFNSTRLFEVLFTASYGGKRTPLRFDVDDLKKRLGLEGKYSRFKDFRYVLDKAQSEFAEFTCLVFTYEPERVGRKYQKVTFYIDENKDFSPKIKLPDFIARRAPRQEDKDRLLLEVQAIDALREIGWGQDIEKTLAVYGPEQVLAIVKYVQGLRRRSMSAGREIENEGGLVATLLKQGFSVPGEIGVPEAGSKQVEIDRAQVKSIATKLIGHFQSAREGIATTKWLELSVDEQSAVHSIMRATLHDFTLELIEADGWVGALYESNRMSVMKSHGFIAFPDNLASLEAFFKKSAEFDKYSDGEKELIVRELNNEA